MNTTTIDNSDGGEILASILWQYEHASNVVGVIETFKAAYDASTKDFFDALLGRYDLSDENISDFGLAVWGVILDLPRPYVDGAMLSSDIYRRLLLGKLRLLNTDATIDNYIEYCNLVFGDGNVSVVDNGDMALTFVMNDGVELDDELEAVLEMQESLLVYPAGVKSNVHSDSPVFCFAGQLPVQNTDDPVAGGLDDSGFCWRYTKQGNWR